MTWTEYFLKMAELVAQKSKDRKTKIGAVIVGPEHEVRSIGFNGFPRGVDDDVDSRHERPAKYLWTEHAERNAIYNAARNGVHTEGCTLYLNAWFPCADCARAVIQAGILRVVVDRSANDALGDRWSSSSGVGMDMMAEAGVECVEVQDMPEKSAEKRSIQ